MVTKVGHQKFSLKKHHVISTLICVSTIPHYYTHICYLEFGIIDVIVDYICMNMLNSLLLTLPYVINKVPQCSIRYFSTHIHMYPEIPSPG